MNVDPDGTFGIFALFTIAALIGAAVGVGVSAYKDYTDDGELFNGSVSWKEYLYNAAFFACVAVFVVATLPYTASLAGSLTFGGAMFGGGGAAVMGTSLVISGATVIGAVQVLSAAGALGILLSSDERPGDNRKQNEQFRAAARKLGLNLNDPNVKDDLQQAHQYIKDNRLNYGFRALVEFIKDFLGL